MSKKQKYDISEQINEQINNVKKRTPMIFYLTMFIFIVCCATALVLLGLFLWLVSIDVIEELNIWWAVILLMVASIAISTSLVRGLGNKILFGSLRQIITASKAVANGDFSQRLEAPKEKETAEICESFNEMVNKLGNNEMLARDFVSNVSHQFKTPLSTIHGYAQLLESDVLTEDERSEYISEIKEKSIHLSDLVNDILELSRLEHQSSAISKESFSLDEQLRKCLISLDKQLAEKNIEVVIDIDSCTYNGSKELLSEVWMNLFENALKFSNQNGTISVNLKCNNHEVLVTVADSGIGMSDETIKSIFERFYRSSDVQNRSGSGLGLSIVKTIIEKHGGSIAVQSEPEMGSVFTVTLPK